MNAHILPILELHGDKAKSLGHQHGESFREQIAEIAEIRLERMCSVSKFKRSKDVLTLAEQHVPILRAFDGDLYTELLGISEASNISMARLVVLNHYTDLRDLEPGVKAIKQQDSGGCSIIYSPGPQGPILGQTWDIHASAQPYVLMLKVRGALVFSIMGCLGMTGINQYGVAIAINNLSSIDAKMGVVWPALVRKALSHKTAVMAKQEIINAPNGSGRHYAIADEHNFFGIETSGTKKKIICDRADQLYFHTNHCLDPEMRKTHIIRKDSNTLWRFEYLDQVSRQQDLSSPEQVFLAFKPISMTIEHGRPHQTTTCGTIVMDIKGHRLIGCRGIADESFLHNQALSMAI